MIVRASAMRHALTIFVKRGKEKEGRKKRMGGRKKQSERHNEGVVLKVSVHILLSDSTINNNLLIDPISRMWPALTMRSPLLRARASTRAPWKRVYRSRDVRASGREFSFPVLFPGRVRLISDARIIRNRWI